MQNSLIDQGLSLMLYGMSTVFIFLTILVFATALMSKIVAKLTTNTLSEKSNSEPMISSSNALVTQEKLAAIKKAISAHRRH